MFVKIHATGGHSFKGLVSYLTEDENRVDFITTRNLVTQNPMTIANVMAATAMNQAALKEAAGIRNTGRKPGGAVMHFTLSWKDEEAKDRNLDRAEIERSVDTVLAKLGAKTKVRSQYADEHQVLMVQHNDKDHSHVHVAVNRVHPEHGVMLPTSNNFLKASKWALKYERETGRIYCPERAINWKARERQEYAKYKEQSRKVWEAKKKAANENRPELDKTVADNKAKDKAIYQKGRELKKAHFQQWQQISDQYKERIAGIEAEAKKVIAQAIAKVRQEFRPQWERRFKEQEYETRKFEKDETNFIGRVMNSVKAVDFKAIFDARERRNAISEAFGSFASAGARLEAFKSQQSAKDAELEAEQKAAEEKTTLPHQDSRKTQIAGNRDRFQKERSDLILKQGMENAAFKSEWQERNRQRKSSYRSHATKYVNDAAEKLALAQAKLKAVEAKKQQHSPAPSQDMKTKIDAEQLTNNPALQEATDKLRNIELKKEFQQNAQPQQSQTPKQDR